MMDTPAMDSVQPPLVTIERAGVLIVVSFKATSIDIHNFVAIADELEEIARSPRPQSVVIDLVGVRRIDELGLAVLQSLQESVKEVGGTAILCGPTDPIEKARHETRLAKEIHDRDSRRRPPQWTQW